MKPTRKFIVVKSNGDKYLIDNDVTFYTSESGVGYDCQIIMNDAYLYKILFFTSEKYDIVKEDVEINPKTYIETLNKEELIRHYSNIFEDEFVYDGTYQPIYMMEFISKAMRSGYSEEECRQAYHEARNKYYLLLKGKPDTVVQNDMELEKYGMSTESVIEDRRCAIDRYIKEKTFVQQKLKEKGL